MAAPDVLIVGAGPTGLMAACELAARGVSCRIIDKAPERSDKSRALIVQPRTLEILAQMGIADELCSLGQRSLSINLHVDARRVVSVAVQDIGIGDTAFPFLLFASQVQTEQVLEKKLEGLGVRVERPVELVTLEQEQDGIVAELEEGGRRQKVRVSYVLGADGAHSTVRRAAGLDFLGDRYPQDFVLADVDLDWEYPHGGVHLFMARQGVFACLPMAGERAYRLLATRGLAVANDTDPTIHEIRDIARQMTGLSLRIDNPRWLARFRLHHRGVEHYRKGRLLIAGDAAHIHSPAGGQGMNTGMQDAYNLAWKLALVLARKAPEALLDSYHAERHPVGQRLLSTTDRLFRFGSSSNWFIAQIRRVVVPRVAPRVLGEPQRRARALRFVSQLAIRYRASPLASPPAQADGLLEKGPAAGYRAPDGVLDGDQWLLSLLKGQWFHLVVFCQKGSTAQAEALQQSLIGFQDIVEVVLVTREASPGSESLLFDRSGILHVRYGVQGTGLYLIRPDGYIAQRCSGDDPAPILAWLEAHIGRSSLPAVAQAR